MILEIWFILFYLNKRKKKETQTKTNPNYDSPSPHWNHTLSSM